MSMRTHLPACVVLAGFALVAAPLIAAGNGGPEAKVCASGTCEDQGCEVHDQGGVANTYVRFADGPGTFLQQFRPSAYPFRYTDLCVGWTQDTGHSSVHFRMKMYDENMQLLCESVEMTASLIPALPENRIDSYSLAGLGCSVVSSGSVYMGVEWDYTEDPVGLATDFTGADIELWSIDSAGTWQEVPSIYGPFVLRACGVSNECAEWGSGCENEIYEPHDGAVVSTTPQVRWECVYGPWAGKTPSRYVVQMREPCASPWSGTGCGEWFDYCEVTDADPYDDNPAATSCSNGAAPLQPDRLYEAHMQSYEYDDEYGSWHLRCTSSTTSFQTAAPPGAAFSWTPAAPLEGETVSFLDESTGDPTSWSWTFGDGGTSTLQNPTHTFGAAGTYEVTLSVGNAVAADSISHEVVARDNFVPVARPEVQLSTPGADVGPRVDVAVDRQGRRYFVWREHAAAKRTVEARGADGDAANGILGQIFDPDDTPVTTPVDVDGGEQAAVDSPSVSVDGEGRAVVTWEKGGLKSDGNELWGCLLGSDLAVVSEPSSLGAGEALRVAASARGDSTVVWRERMYPSAAQTASRELGEIYGRRLGAYGVPAGEKFLVGDEAGEEVGEPSVSSDASGNSVVVFWSGGAAAKSLQDGNGIMTVFLPPSGTTTSDSGQANSDGAGTTGDASVATGPLGSAVVVWAQDRGDGNGVDIYGRRYGADHEAKGDAFLVNSNGSGDQGAPAAAVNAEGDFVVVWESRTSSKAGDDTAIRGRLFHPDGVPMGADFNVVKAAGGLEPGHPEVSMSGDDTVTVVYTKSDGSGNQISASFTTFDVNSPSGTCEQDESTLCLNDDRFQVEVRWRDYGDRSGLGRAVQLTSDTGYFWFFKETNVELIIKVLDGVAVNNHYWVFYGALSSVDYTVSVTDTVSGNSVAYYNPIGNVASFGDTSAIPVAKAGRAPVTTTREITWGSYDPGLARMLTELAGIEEPPRLRAAGTCTPSSGNLCLNNSRFKVEVDWEDFGGDTGSGTAVPLSTDTGYFWFFRNTNVELVIKVLDGTPINGYFWVFYGALSNVEFEVTVTDTQTDAVMTYTNPSGEFGSLAHTSAFPAP